MTTLLVAGLARFPVKALSAEMIEEIVLEAGRPLPGDRRFALAPATTPVEGLEPAWLPPERLLTLARHPRLALLDTAWNAETGVLTIRRRGRKVVGADITTAPGRAVVADFLGAFLGRGVFGHPRILDRHQAGFGDRARALVSLVGQGSLAELERACGHDIGQARLRVNLVVGGARPWEELGWVGQRLRVGGAVLRGIEVMVRSKPLADPATGEADTAVPLVLEAAFRHRCLGVWAEVVEGGRVAVGDRVAV